MPSRVGPKVPKLTLGIGGFALAFAAQSILSNLIASILQQPAPEVWCEGFDDSSVELAVRYWHAPDVGTLWRVRSDVALAAKDALDAAKIEIPFPRRVVTINDSER
jgi:small-conductance mechanosensitive channel